MSPCHLDVTRLLRRGQVWVNTSSLERTGGGSKAVWGILTSGGCGHYARLLFTSSSRIIGGSLTSSSHIVGVRGSECFFMGEAQRDAVRGAASRARTNILLAESARQNYADMVMIMMIDSSPGRFSLADDQCRLADLSVRRQLRQPRVFQIVATPCA